EAVQIPFEELVALVRSEVTLALQPTHQEFRFRLGPQILPGFLQLGLGHQTQPEHLLGEGGSIELDRDIIEVCHGSSVSPVPQRSGGGRDGIVRRLSPPAPHSFNFTRETCPAKSRPARQGERIALARPTPGRYSHAPCFSTVAEGGPVPRGKRLPDGARPGRVRGRGRKPVHRLLNAGRSASTRWTRRLTGAALASLGLWGCAGFGDEVTSRNFHVQALFVKPDPLVVLRDSSDGDERAKALRALQEPKQNGGTDEEQDALVKILTT